MKLLFVGDVIGKPGRQALQDALLPGWSTSSSVDYVVVNVENAAGGFGVTPDVLAELADLPIDVFTTGNHIWDKKEGVRRCSNAIATACCGPPTTAPGIPGRGLHVGETAARHPGGA